MSLKSFHLVFVIASLVLASWFAVWCYNQGSETGDTGTLAMGVVSLISAVGLAVYLTWILKKLKPMPFVFFLTWAALSHPTTVQACATCFGNPKSPLVQSANTAILFLMGVIGVVLTGFGGLFLSWRARDKKYNADIGPV